MFSGEEEDIAQQIAYRQRSRAAAAAAAAGAAAGRLEGSQPQEQAEAEELDGAIEPQRCKLGQRLLARAAARKQQRAAG